MRPLLRLAVWLSICAALCFGTIASAAPQARVDVGVYAGDVARFDRLTHQHSDSPLVFLGWDQGRTWGSQYSSFLDSLGDRPHIERTAAVTSNEIHVSRKARLAAPTSRIEKTRTH